MPEIPPVMLPPKLDFVFKRLFGDERHIEYLVRFLQAALTLPPEDYADITILNPDLERKFEDDKKCILDVRVRTRSGRVVNIEIQVGAVPGMMERMQFYAAKLVADQLKKGDGYERMPQVICIVILDHRLIRENERYHHRFRLCDPEAGMEYPNSLEIHTLELPKLPTASDGTPLWDWMRFLSSETPEEFAALRERRPDMAGVVARLAELSADERMRMIAEAREKYERDQLARERAAQERERATQERERATQERERATQERERVIRERERAAQELERAAQELERAAIARERGARVEGLAEGLAEGRAEGRAEGEASGRTAVARRMLRSGMLLADVAGLTGLAMADVERLAAEENAEG